MLGETTDWVAIGVATVALIASGIGLYFDWRRYTASRPDIRITVDVLSSGPADIPSEWLSELPLGGTTERAEVFHTRVFMRNVGISSVAVERWSVVPVDDYPAALLNAEVIEDERHPVPQEWVLGADNILSVDFAITVLSGEGAYIALQFALLTIRGQTFSSSPFTLHTM